MLNNLIFQKVYLFLIIIVSINFFESKVLFQNGILNYTTPILFVVLILSLPYVKLKNNGFVLPVYILSFSILFSIFMAHYSWEQTYSDSLKATIPYLLWFYFFSLLKHKLSILFIEKTIIFYGLVYIILFFFQFINSDTPMFGWGEDFDSSRGFVRIVFPGGGLFYLTLFIALNRLNTAKAHRFLWLILLFVSLSIVLMQTTTQFMIGVFLISLFHIIKFSNMKRRLIILIFIFFTILLIANTENTIKLALQVSNEDHTSDGLDYIRILAGMYFLTEFSQDNLARVLGNGVSWGDSFPYGSVMTDLKDSYHFHLTDVGLVAVYAMFGIFATFAFVMIWIKSFVIPLPSQYYYLKYYLWLLLITSFTSHSIFNYNFLIANVLVIYCYHNIHSSNTT
jgi:hypothetical protein